MNLLVGDITEFRGDVIVNAANSTLLGGGGVDGAIHRAGGMAILEDCRRIRQESYPQGLPPGEAVASTAGELPLRAVIHTVGPVWNGGAEGEDQILALCYHNCLAIALEQNWFRIAFPAIATGVYGFPKERAAGIVSRVLRETSVGQLQPSLYFFQPADKQIFELHSNWPDQG